MPTQHKGISAAERKLKPVHDPDSTKYPDRIFYKGQWRTLEQIERSRAHHREWSRNYERLRRANDEDYRERRRKMAMEYFCNKYRNDPNFRETIKRRTRERRQALVSSGVCASCGKAPAAQEGAWRCNSCADKLLTPEYLLAARRREALKRKAKRHQTGRS